MINHVWSVLCQSSSIDAETNALSLFNTLETITISGEIPTDQEVVINFPFNLISFWVRSDSDEPANGKMRVSLNNPNSDSHGKEIETDIDLTKSTFFRSRFFSQGIKWFGPGKYVFVVEYLNESLNEWQGVAEIPFWIKISQ